jgi:RNA polymerase sigma factor (sigma-70 family)
MFGAATGVSDPSYRRNLGSSATSLKRRLRKHFSELIPTKFLSVFVDHGSILFVMSVDFSDAQLLRDFASSRDQRAFAELVARHQDMVFGTALRRTGRADLAADIAQHVFLALAHKAAWLSTRPNVGGWLYKATLLESIRRQRDESRRHSRERRYAEEEMKNHPPLDARSTPDADADACRARDLLPHLDDALAALPATDREAVVLRFFRGLSLRETGAALGTSEEAARKRVSRALEKLSSLFRRRGLTTTSTLLATTLLPQAVTTAPAAPAGLTMSLTKIGASVPQTSPAGLLFLKSAALTKSQLVAACALTAAVPVTWQAHHIQSLERENRALQSHSVATHTPPATTTPPPPLATMDSTPSTAHPPTTRPETTTVSNPYANRRGKWDEWRELQRQQQRESRLAAIHERLGLDDTQLAVIAEATARAEAAARLAHETARTTHTPLDPAVTATAIAQRDATIAAALGPDEWPEYQAFVREEEASRREIFANRLLADLQTTLHLSDAQKDTLFAHFATETTASEIDSWRTPIESMDPAQTEKLADVLSEEQFKLWRQRAEIWSQLFRRSPETAPRDAR